MGLTTLDWIVIVLFIVLIMAVGLSYTKKASKDMESFFLGGRNMPWLLAGKHFCRTSVLCFPGEGLSFLQQIHRNPK